MSAHASCTHPRQDEHWIQSSSVASKQTTQIVMFVLDVLVNGSTSLLFFVLGFTFVASFLLSTLFPLVCFPIPLIATSNLDFIFFFSIFMFFSCPALRDYLVSGAKGQTFSISRWYLLKLFKRFNNFLPFYG
ncbi:unnamed protein product [Chrysodeixis includens]|uniref:Transmembrane protein n=1 Tax=Chrysodeixis includens TaxID=689277 RepID=A0A9N8L587_CHRIL|nr:unnamed protein product [Chrysodeixis includens]